MFESVLISAMLIVAAARDPSPVIAESALEDSTLVVVIGNVDSIMPSRFLLDDGWHDHVWACAQIQVEETLFGLVPVNQSIEVAAHNSFYFMPDGTAAQSFVSGAYWVFPGDRFLGTLKRRDYLKTDGSSSRVQFVLDGFWILTGETGAVVGRRAETVRITNPAVTSCSISDLYLNHERNWSRRERTLEDLRSTIETQLKSVRQ